MRKYFFKALSLAIIIFASCKSNNVSDPEIARLIFQAESAFRGGYYNAALSIADSVISRSPDAPDIHFLKGRVLTKLSRFVEAENAYREVISLDDKYQGAWFNMGTNYLRQNKTPQAIYSYNNEMETHPTAQTMVQIGKAYSELGKPDSAFISFEKAIHLNRVFAPAYMRLSHLKKDAGDINEAITYAKKGMEIDPDNIDYKYFMGSLLLLNGEPKLSIPFFNEVVNNKPWHYWAHHNLGQALFRAGDKTQSEYYITKAKDLQRGIQEVENWRNLAKMNPDQFMLWINLGNSLNTMGRINEARDAFLVGLSIKPMNVAVQNNIANLSLMLGDTVGAIIRYQTILSLDSTIADVWQNLGVVYASTGKKNEARNSWEKAIKYEPNNNTVIQYLKTINE
jgi:tetratricopeptide (TPR) repeat protein